MEEIFTQHNIDGVIAFVSGPGPSESGGGNGAVKEARLIKNAPSGLSLSAEGAERWRIPRHVREEDACASVWCMWHMCEGHKLTECLSRKLWGHPGSL